MKRTVRIQVVRYSRSTVITEEAGFDTPAAEQPTIETVVLHSGERPHTEQADENVGQITLRGGLLSFLKQLIQG